jgi:serine phosphatase RsbU (regulator of sigma subunit)/CHASE3 domain sensor protein
MKNITFAGVGQIVGVGFGLILMLALLVGVLGRLAYDVSQQQNRTVQTRGDVERLTLQLEIISAKRTDALRRYLQNQDVTLLSAYQTYQLAYADTTSRLLPLLSTPQEHQALNSVSKTEAQFNRKAQEIIDLSNDGFPAAAQFLWDNEGVQSQQNLLTAIENLRDVQGRSSSEIIESARQSQQITIMAISLFIPLLLAGGIVASWLITRSINRPISNLVTTVKHLGTDLNTRVDPSGPQEIAFLGENINEMAENLRQSRRSLQQHNDRLEQELALASQIQASFLPTKLPKSPGIDVAVLWKSAREVGGDFYANVQLNNGYRGVAVGDVSGKGTPAAMVGALSVGLLQAYAENHPRPETLLSELNRDLCQRLARQSMNVACCYAVIDVTAGVLTVANAGCMYPYLRRDASIHEIAARGMPLGVMPDFDYVSVQVAVQPGDLLVFSSDGLVEAKNSGRELFGFDRLHALIMDLPPQAKAQTVVRGLVEAAIEFTGSDDLHDDVTIMAVRVL